MNIAKSVVIKGELRVVEDLLIEGQVDGVIQLSNHVLTIGPSGRVNAEVFAKSVIVLGAVTGAITATDTIEISDNGSVDGDVVASRLRIAEGAHFQGFVEMPKAPRPIAGASDGVRPSGWLPPEKIAVEVERPAAFH